MNIVLLEPEIPNNTGNIGRLSLAAGCELHLIKPLGFELSDSRVKRSGLDYWTHVRLTIHENWTDFLDFAKGKPMAFFSSHGKHSYYDLKFEEQHFLIFGKESKGLPKEVLEQFMDETYTIPVKSEHVRSLNLANAVSAVVYEGNRQLR